jgi:tmRNA-binding protein
MNSLYAKSIHIGVLKNLSNKSSIDPLVERKIFLHKKEIYFLCK